MNIEVTYSEAVDIKVALEHTIADDQEVLNDETFRKQYPGITASLREQIRRAQGLLLRIQQELDKLN